MSLPATPSPDSDAFVVSDSGQATQNSNSDAQWEQPLPAARYALFLFSATLLVAGFYLYALVALLLGALSWVLALVIAILGAQYGGLALAGPLLTGIGASLKVLANGLRLRKGADFSVKLARDEAPALWKLAEEFSRALKVAPPREVVLENGVNAYVMLSGWFTGRGKTRLGVGFDLLAGLSESGARAVMAHEIAHAKHVQRGYKGYLMRGWARTGQCAGALKAVANEESNHGAVRFVAQSLGALPDWIGRVAGRLIAACSRYDEFLADRIAAQLCGKDACRQALLATHVLDFQADRIDYRERLLHLERAPGYAAWLCEKLDVPDDAKRLELEARALERAHRHEMSTHPALPDRLRALDESETLAPPFQGAKSALVWLSDANAAATKLLREVERVAAEEERRATASLAKWMRKGSAYSKHRRDSNILFSIGAIGVALLVWLNWTQTWKDGEEFWVVNGVFGGAAALFLIFGFTARRQGWKNLELPIPTFVDYRAALFGRRDENRAAREAYQVGKTLPEREKYAMEIARDETDAAKNVALGAQIRAEVPAEISKPAALARHFAQRGFEALAKCDYARASLCARLALDEKPNFSDALVIWGVCGAFQAQDGSESALQTLGQTRATFSTRWASAWAMCLWNNTGGGEAFLLDLTRHKRDSPMLWALLGYCQAANGKPRESLVSRKRALELCSQNGFVDEDDEACHRFVLAQNLTALGQLGEARGHLDWLREYTKRASMRGLEARNLELEEIKWLLSSGEETRALERARFVDEAFPEARHRLELAESLAGSSERATQDAAKSLFERVLESGNYPQARVALSRLAWECDDKAQARLELLAALPCEKIRPLDAVHPLSILGDVLDGLRAVDDLMPAKVTAWETHLDAADSPLEVKKLSLLCLAPDEAAARNRALEIFRALWADADLESKVSLAVAGKEMQPDDVAPPGIYGCKWES